MPKYTYMQESKSAWSKTDKLMVFLGGSTLGYFVSHDILLWIHREFFALACYVKDYI